MKYFRKLLCAFIGCRFIVIYKKTWNERDSYETSVVIFSEIENIQYRCECCGVES